MPVRGAPGGDGVSHWGVEAPAPGNGSPGRSADAAAELRPAPVGDGNAGPGEKASGGRPGGTSGQAAAPSVRPRRGGEQPMVPQAEPSSYYGLPILNAPTWRSPEIPGYLFAGGLAGASSVLAAGAQATGRQALATRSKVVAAAAIAVGGAALVRDLGRPARFANMLRVIKPTSPMSVGSWLLAAYGPAAGGAAAAAALRRAPRLGAAATAAAATVGPLISTYTAALICDTAVPAWHDGHREMPLVFAGSSAMAAGGAALVAAPVAETAPARRLALCGVALETAARRLMDRRLGMVAEPYHQGKAGSLLRAADVLTATGSALVLVGRRRRVLGALGGAALVASSACTRFGIFEAGKQSAADPKYVVEPQRGRT